MPSIGSCQAKRDKRSLCLLIVSINPGEEISKNPPDAASFDSNSVLRLGLISSSLGPKQLNNEGADGSVGNESILS